MGPKTRSAFRTRAAIVISCVGLLGCGAGSKGDGAKGGEPERTPVRRPAEAPRSSLAFRVVADDSSAAGDRLVAADGEALVLLPGAVLTERDISAVEVGPGMIPDGHAVFIHLAPDGARRLREASREHVGRRMANVIDGEAVLAPRIQGEVSSPFVLENDYGREDAMRMARRLAP